jgi:hypothetical protein
VRRTSVAKTFSAARTASTLLHQKSEGYYNNTLTEPLRRLGAQVLENSLFSKTIALRMVRVERAKVCAYLALWLICLLNRRSDLGWIVAASQAVFSEQVFSKYVRLEWLRMRFEKTFDDVYRLFQAKPAASQVQRDGTGGLFCLRGVKVQCRHHLVLEGIRACESLLVA